MAIESFLVATLPRSADAGEVLHVSLFVTHRLTPDGARGRLADFPHVVDWTTRLAGAHIELTGRTGGGSQVAIPATPALAVLEPQLWERVFPPELEVRPWKTPDPAATPWRTFPAHRMQQHALLAHAAAVYSSPVGSPSVRGNALTRPLLEAMGLGKTERALTVERLLDPDVDIDQTVTRVLGRRVGGGLVGQGTGAGASSSAPLSLLATDAHRARLFYQRPEEQHPYRAEPAAGARGAPIVRPKPDFHERASMIGDLSPLLRRIGLVIDLRVDDPGSLAGLTEIRAAVHVPGLANPVSVQPATSCAVQGTAFFATSATGDYTGPLLRLGDEERFRVLDLDPDASALKLEQYVRTLPRLLAIENNGERESSSPPTLRATGFALARVDRAQRLHDRLQGAPLRDAAVLSGTAPPMRLEDLARGVRLEVWDDVTREWHSLHRRRIDVEVEGAGLIFDDLPDTGFLQGAALTRADGPNGEIPGAPYQAHEVVAGWDGWSLAAPRPGKVVVHEDGEEKLVDAPDPDPDPVNPVATKSRIEPRTLPWLRYGRSYSFRAWAVDLAGNSAPHAVAGPPEVDPDSGDGADPPIGRPRPIRRRVARPPANLVRSARRVAASRLAELPPDATLSSGRPETARAAEEIRRALRTLHPVEEPGPREDAGAGGIDLTAFAPTGFDDVDQLIRERFTRRRSRRTPEGPTRRERIEAGFHRELTRLQRLLERTDARTPPDLLAEALAAAALSKPGWMPLTPQAIAVLADLVTTPRPFLRWDPVIEPVVVPRHPYTEAESQLTLVVRSGVEGPAGASGLELEIVPPEIYSARMRDDHPELDLQWRADSQRHLAPPKTSQLEAEMHGLLDTAFGSASGAEMRKALAVALRESGTLLDPTVADLSQPGARLEQPGIAFHTSPTADAPSAPTPADLERGDPLTPGQYVVHDTDRLVLPYLPDPLATGLSMVFPDAGRDHHLFGLFATEGVTLRYGRSWPDLRPYRVVLESGEELAARVDGDVIRMKVPPGEQLRMRLSSALDREKLELLGLWRSLPDSISGSDVIAEAAADGWLWWLTPATEVRFVHAVPRPIEAPRPTLLVPSRRENDTAVTLVGGVDLHGPSTERLDIEASWSEWIDDPGKEEPSSIDVVAAAADTAIRYDEDLVVLSGQDRDLPLPDGTVLHLHKAVHQLGDTKHRDITYRMRATTRYREYFDPRALPDKEDLSVVGPERVIDVPSTARPAKPVVRDVVPLFRWYEETEPEQPFGLRRVRRAGLRLYLERPWFSSGDGELLGLLLAHRSDVGKENQVSQWGGDPVFLQQGPARRSVLPLVDLAHLVGLDDRREGARPVGPPTLRRLEGVPGRPTVWVLGYQPEFSRERGMWFVDVAFDPGTAVWPFVRLAVARYQPSSLPGKHLSPVVRCEMVPLPPERTATLSRPDPRHARVVVTGPVGAPSGLVRSIARPPFLSLVAASRVLRVRLERKVPAIDTDLGWETVATRELPILGADGTVVSWSGELELPRSVPPRRPGSSRTWRVAIEEWERFPADPHPVTRAGGVEARMVYADHLPL